jgi:hypothetical protein
MARSHTLAGVGSDTEPPAKPPTVPENALASM